MSRSELTFPKSQAKKFETRYEQHREVMESGSHLPQTEGGGYEKMDKNRIPVLFEEIVRQLDLALAEDGWASTQADLAIYLDEVALGLRHWNQDIKNHKEGVLEKVE